MDISKLDLFCIDVPHWSVTEERDVVEPRFASHGDDRPENDDAASESSDRAGESGRRSPRNRT